jgi:AcrR family transcriptional regulator/DNA-binding MarR family transcriptional regulator
VTAARTRVTRGANATVTRPNASGRIARSRRRGSLAAGRPIGIDRDSQVARLVEIQRARVMAGAVEAIDELGYAGTSVSCITRRTSVSRRTFYELFADREECLVAVLEEIVARIAAELQTAGVEDLPWRERVRVGLWTILSFFDREPALARVCVVQALCGGPRVLARREELLAGLARAVDEDRGEGTGARGARGARPTRLTAEGLVGAAFAIVYARVLRGEREPLVSLLGELMGLIVLPYAGPAAARRELARPVPAVPSAHDGEPPTTTSVGDPLEGTRMRLTYRTSRVLEGVAERPGASNRAIAEYAGVADPGQISKLLARLERADLVANTGQGHPKGEPNAWTLTPRGERLACHIKNVTKHACAAPGAGTPDPTGEE